MHWKKPVFCETGRIESLEDFSQRVTGKFETFHQLSRGKVELADYGAIIEYLNLPKTTSVETINQLLLECCAKISENQLSTTLEGKINSQIPYEQSTVKGYRPIGYGRAALFEMKVQDRTGKLKNIVLDVKGIGGLRVTPTGYTSGLLVLGKALKDYYFEKLTQAIWRHSRLERENIESLAVISTGFQAYDPNLKGLGSGAILVRKAHYRGYQGNDSIVNIAGIPTYRERKYLDRDIATEMTLRKYGVSASVIRQVDQRMRQAWNAGTEQLLGYGFSSSNLQQSHNLKLLDFEAYRSASVFMRPLVFAAAYQEETEPSWQKFLENSYLYGQSDFAQIKSILKPMDQKFISKPDPGLSVDPCFESELDKPDTKSLGQHFCDLMVPFLGKLNLTKIEFSWSSKCQE